MSTFRFTKADTIEDTVDELIKQIEWMMGKLDSKNVKRLDTNETVIKSKSGKTYIHGPILEMDDTTRRRLNMGLNESTNDFLFELYNEAGAKTVSIDSDGKGVFNQVTLRNDLVGSAYVQINTSGLVAYNGTVKTVEVNSNGNATFKQVTLRNDLTGSNYINIDTSGIYAWDNALMLKTFEIDSSGKAYFRGDITSDATITGAAINGATITGGTIRTAASGARLELTSGIFKGYNSSNQLHGIYVDPTSYVDFILYKNGSEFFKIYDNVSDLDIKAFGDLILTYADAVGRTYPKGTWDFSASSVSGLTTDTYPNHNHGIPDGTVLAVDGGGTVTWAESGSHAHNVG
jgi:hypothetical protein